MQLWVGLGNPGARYAHNRHNAGFMVLDRIADAHGFSPWRLKFQGQASTGRFGSTKVVLLKPETFMNNSGQSVQAAIRFYKLVPEDVLVFHDEIDLAPGKIRVKSGGGHAGHNGLRSLHTHIGANYSRVRIGVGHPGRKEEVAAYVLSDFDRADQGWLNDALGGVADGAAALAAGDTGRFLGRIALRPNPHRDSGPRIPQKPGNAPAPGVSDTHTPLQKVTGRFR
ncbi:MAG: aminoacyl-tRNA hydrolase [Rhodobacteraceae bacterium]|nr:aminoacyl-tRNA hydrolase [Paracoccaceae bacterium]